MIEIATSAVQRFLKTPDAAIHLGLSARTLEKHRCYGTGPVYRKLGGRIVYAIADLNAWAEIADLHIDEIFDAPTCARCNLSRRVPGSSRAPCPEIRPSSG